MAATMLVTILRVPYSRYANHRVQASAANSVTTKIPITMIDGRNAAHRRKTTRTSDTPKESSMSCQITATASAARAYPPAKPTRIVRGSPSAAITSAAMRRTSSSKLRTKDRSRVEPRGRTINSAKRWERSR